jgi:catechol 2,3-dioxygenase-like lactoylglutathione lyase family enzyme
MKRLHIHMAVDDLPRSIGFYAALFDAQPRLIKADYAKWMLEDPRVNFAISTRGRQRGLDHLGIQVENTGELQEVYARLHKAGGDIIEQGATVCCYAKSENPGSTTQRVWRGKPSSRPGRAPIMAMAPVNEVPAWCMRNRARAAPPK